MSLRLSSRIFRSVVNKTDSLRFSLNNARSFSSLLSSQKCHQRTLFRSNFSRFQSSACSTDVALRDFLKEEIEAEKTIAQKQLGEQHKTPVISGFDMKTDGAEVTLTKTHNNEKITIRFNVNDCVRPQDDVETGTMDKYEQMQQEKQDGATPMLAEPCFQVEIEKNNQKLVFECDFASDYNQEELPQEQQEENEDLFNISSVYLMQSGTEISDKIYGASGEILDGTLYDHFFNYLEERGIDNKFADELIGFATHYEHAQYVNLLQNLREFVSK
uniref:Complement component 1 Q subcomponent-binding protein, mitochondrial n=1 Tax=Romanomermis culicivorax TaxID=13658 RepID=A0A915HY08_ROMCU